MLDLAIDVVRDWLAGRRQTQSRDVKVEAGRAARFVAIKMYTDARDSDVCVSVYSSGKRRIVRQTIRVSDGYWQAVVLVNGMSPDGASLMVRISSASEVLLREASAILISKPPSDLPGLPFPIPDERLKAYYAVDNGEYLVQRILEHENVGRKVIVWRGESPIKWDGSIGGLTQSEAKAALKSSTDLLNRQFEEDKKLGVSVDEAKTI
jgi:hypothetical protein